MGTSAGFWDRIAERYARQPVADEASYQKKLEITRRYFRPDSQVMEFGCGTGSTAIAHAPFVKHIHAIDVSANMIAIARRKAEAQDIDNVTFEQATIEAYDAPDGSLDAVLGMSILHLLDDKEAALAKVLRLLKPGGVFASSTVCLGDTMAFFKYIAPIGAFFRVIPSVKVFTEQELLAAITQAGFVIDHHWRPDKPNGKGKSLAVFIVARKPATA